MVCSETLTRQRPTVAQGEGMIYVKHNLEVNEKFILTIKKREDGFADISMAGGFFDRILGITEIVSDISFYEVLEKIKDKK